MTVPDAYTDRYPSDGVPVPGVHVGNVERCRVSAELLTPCVRIRGLAKADSLRDVLILGPNGNRSDWLTVTFADGIVVNTGCFCGSLEAFEREVERKDAADPSRLEYEAYIALIRVVAELRGTPAPAPALPQTCYEGD